jgi:hypothetical protein
MLMVPAGGWFARHDLGSAREPCLATARDAVRGRLLALGAGLLAAGALAFTARNVALSREGRLTARCATAVEQLGSEELDVRIGGIRVLERVAREAPAETTRAAALVRRDKLLTGQQRAVPTLGNLRPAELRVVPGGSRGRVDCPSVGLRPAFPSALASSGAA